MQNTKVWWISTLQTLAVINQLSPNEEIIEQYSASHYRTGVTFEKHMLIVEIDQNKNQVLKMGCWKILPTIWDMKIT